MPMLIQANNFTKYYGTKTAIENVTFWVNNGQVFGILGPEGAGKTTVMRVLAGYTPPSDGKVTVAGFDVLTHSLEVRKRVGYVPAGDALYQDMTVCSYLTFVAKLRKVPNRSERVTEIVNKMNLSAQAEQRIGRLPKGICRRVGISQAILHNPDVLILDEPTAGLSPVEIVEIHQLIRSLGQNHTVILGTRALPEAEQVCSRVMLLDKGRVVAQETPDRLMARLEGGQTIRLQTASAPQNAVEQLQALKDVSRVLVVGPGSFDIECKCGVECRPAVARLVVKKGWGLLELQVVDPSLEKISLELTANIKEPA